MKKLIMATVLIMGLGLSYAQTSPAKSSDKKKPATTATTNSPGPKKKDGTADMRYKANKEAAKSPMTTHLKKDGTPDKRFKENKKPPAK